MHESFTSSIKQELKTCVLFETSSGVMTFLKMKTLKRFFLSSLYFYPDMDNKASASLLVNVPSLSNTIWTCFGYFLGYQRLCLISARSVKSTNVKDLWVRGTCIKNISAKITCTKNTYARGIDIKSICIEGISIEGWVLLGCGKKTTCL